MSVSAPESAAPRTVVIGCGAIAQELRSVLQQLASTSDLEPFDVHFLPANLHNRPERIPNEVRTAVLNHADSSDRVLVAYADCGTGGLLDAALATPELASYRATRLAGAHCYELYAGPALFAALSDVEPGTFYLTDFLAKHFEPLVWEGLGLDRHPDLRDQYFGNYQRVVQLGQATDAAEVDRLQALGRAAAEQLGLSYEFRPTGLTPLTETVLDAIRRRN